MSQAARKHPEGIAWILIACSIGLLAFIFLLPMLVVFTRAFADGAGHFFNTIRHPDTLSALRLTLTVAGISVVVSTAFGVVAAYTLVRFRFPGRAILLTVTDLPFSVSPVVSGLSFALLFGRMGPFHGWLSEHGIQILFATPGMVLATCFVTLPFVVRELIPLMTSQGSEEEVASVSLGASAWRTYLKVTLPNIQWALLFGIVLCNARAIGEFGAVSVVSGHIRGKTNTLPLHVESLYNEYDFSGAFAVSALLAMLAIITIILKTILENRVLHNAGRS